MNNIRKLRIVLSIIAAIITVAILIYSWSKANKIDGDTSTEVSSQECSTEDCVDGQKENQNTVNDAKSSLSTPSGNWDQIKKCLPELSEISGNQLITALYNHLKSQADSETTTSFKVEFLDNNDVTNQLLIKKDNTASKWTLLHLFVDAKGFPSTQSETSEDDFSSAMSKLESFAQEFSITNTEEHIELKKDSEKTYANLINNEAVELIHTTSRAKLKCVTTEQDYHCNCN